jgi:putative hydrolase
MSDQIRLDEDWRVSSTFSSGAATIEESVEAAEHRDLRALCIVDRVGRTSGWLPEFVEACAVADRWSRVEVSSGIEVEVLDTNGQLEMPTSACLVDHVFVTAHLLPTPDGPIQLGEALEEMRAGSLLQARAVEWLVRAYAGAASRVESIALVHPFRVLEPLGIEPGNVHPSYVRWLAAELAGAGASVVIDEDLRCPENWITDAFLAAGVEIRP